MHGRALLGAYQAKPGDYLYGFRDRMDERYDFVRGVRDARYLYVRNYMPHRVYGQHVSYMFETPTTQVWKALYDADRLEPPQTFFWETKPAEELYDLQTDPDEVRNLASDPGQQGTLQRLRAALRGHLLSIRDLGFLPEPELHDKTGAGAPYRLGHDAVRYPLETILDTAELASQPGIKAVAELKIALSHPDSTVRYWGAVGLLARGQPAVGNAGGELRHALGDGSVSVRVVAAEALGRYGDPGDVAPALDVLLTLANLDDNDVFTALMALNSLDYLDQRAESALPAIRALPLTQDGMLGQFESYVPRLVERILTDFDR